MVTDRPLFNVLLLSFGFMLVFTAFQTMGNIEVSVARSARLMIYYVFTIVIIITCVALPHFPMCAHCALIVVTRYTCLYVCCMYVKT